MNIVILYIIIHYYIPPSCTFLNKIETKVSFDLIKELEIRHCIFIGKTNDRDLIFAIKNFSSANIPTIYLNYTELIEYTDNITMAYCRVGLIFKEENLSVAQEIFGDLDKENQIFKLRNFVWLTFLQDQTKKPSSSKLAIPYDCEFITIQARNEGTYQLTEIYKVKSKQFSLDFGTWERNIGLRTSNISFYARRFNLQNTELHLVSSNDAKTMAKLYGIFQHVYELIAAYAVMMNFTCQRYIRKPGENISELLKKVEDISELPIPFRTYSVIEHIVDVAGPVFKSTVNWFIKYPRTELQPDYYLQPFDKYLWLALFLVASIGTFLIVLSQSLTGNTKRLFIDSLFLGVETFSNQCGSADIKSFTLRLICIFLRLIALLSLALYGAIVTSFFAIESFRPPFTNIDEFMANGEYTLITMKDADLKTVLNDNNPTHKNFYANFTKYYSTHRFEEYFQEICRGKYAAYHYDQEGGFNLLIGFPRKGNDLKWPCRIFKIPKHLGIFWNGLILKRHSPFTKIFNKNMIRYTEKGLKMHRKLTAFNHDLSETDIPPINIELMTQVLLIPLIGIFLGIAILVIEIIQKRK